MKSKIWSDHGSNVVQVSEHTGCGLIPHSGQVDFDGDEMSATLAPDRTMVRLFEPLKPHKSAHSITSYRTMSENFSLSKPVVATISSALSKEDHREYAEEMDEFLV